MRISFSTVVGLTALAVALIATLFLGTRRASEAEAEFVLFRRGEALCEIVLSDPSQPSERQAAQLLAETLAASAGTTARQFTVRDATRRTPARRAIVLRTTSPDRDRLNRTVAYRIGAREIVIEARWTEDLVAAASWFLERELGARWFVPGKSGAEIEPRRELRLKAGAAAFTPGFISRDLGLGGGRANREWFARNRLLSIFATGHTAAELLTREQVQRDPRLRPEFEGRRVVPTSASAWQPDLTSDVTVEHVTRALREKFSSPAAPLAAAFGQNDSWRWDQSAATLAAVAPHRHFRSYPDYSNTLFSFLNRVAANLEREFPDRFVTTYAYQWTENVPRFAVHPNVLPYLTADRSQWFDPDFAANDRDLLQRWGQAGPKIFGLYDYYYGAPYLVPRPTLFAVRASIPFAFAAGARAFYAESNPNWGLDGPKLWLAAQLLWLPNADSAALLDEYYARYWKELAAPMRRFFELGDEQYLRQPRPGYWIKYYKDDHQRILFPPEARQELFAQLDEAASRVRTPVVRERLATVRAAFTVSDLFCRHDETRDELARLTHDARATTEALASAVSAFTSAREALIARHAQVKREHPLAFAAELIPEYLRNDPRPRALRRLAAMNATIQIDARLAATVFAGRAPTAAELTARGTELLRDAAFLTVKKKNLHPFTALEWNEPGGPWRGTGEPFETRRIELPTLSEPSAASAARLVRYSGANQDALYQTMRAQPGALYRATVRVRGKVSPGNMSFLLVSCVRPDGKVIDAGSIDRLPIGDWNEWTTLEMIVRAPHDADRIGIGLRALYQVNDDFMEFASPSLQRLHGQ